MTRNSRFLLLAALAFFTSPALSQIHPRLAQVLAASGPSDWRPLNPDHTLYVELPAGRGVIELAPWSAGPPEVAARRAPTCPPRAPTG